MNLYRYEVLPEFLSPLLPQRQEHNGLRVRDQRCRPPKPSARSSMPLATTSLPRMVAGLPSSLFRLPSRSARRTPSPGSQRDPAPPTSIDLLLEVRSRSRSPVGVCYIVVHDARGGVPIGREHHTFRIAPSVRLDINKKEPNQTTKTSRCGAQSAPKSGVQEVRIGKKNT